MFQSLIESTTHHLENKRRAAFLMGTTALYGVLLTMGGIASVYAYDSHLENQNLELVSVLAATAPAEKPKEPQTRPTARVKASDSNQVPTVTQRVTMRPEAGPRTIQAVVKNAPPADVGAARLGKINSLGGNRNLTFSETEASGPATGTGNEQPLPPPPPPARPQPTPQPKATPTPAPAPTPARIISLGVINGKAVSLPKPAYSAIARAAHASGVVQVQVTIDETGKVVAAHAVAGHPLLQPDAIRAAYAARFTPTFLSNQPVKVTGFINYNFQQQ